VLDTMEYRMKRLGVGWNEEAVAQIYTVHDIHSLMPKIQERVEPCGITRHHCRPPIEGLDYEMDVRAVSVERVLA
jgi:hypothetical protein